MEILAVFGIIILIIVSIIVGSFGKKREIGFAGAFFASLFFTPILAMLFVLASDKNPIQKEIKKSEVNNDYTGDDPQFDFIDDKGNVRHVTIKTGEKAGWKPKN
jgi:hypothetical protein